MEENITTEDEVTLLKEILQHDVIDQIDEAKKFLKDQNEYIFSQDFDFIIELSNTFFTELPNFIDKPNKYFNQIANPIKQIVSNINNIIGFSHALISGNVARKMDAEKHLPVQISTVVNTLEDTLTVSKIFQSFKFFSGNVVLIGANGSGKTSLAKFIQQYPSDTITAIPACRILNFKNLDNFQRPEKAGQNYAQIESARKNLKGFDFRRHLDDFPSLLGNLISKHVAFLDQFRHDTSITEKSELEWALDIWNELFPMRIMEMAGGQTFEIKDENEKKYNIEAMSEGEKVCFYLLGHISLVRDNSLIIIDEPETHLHTALTKRLWDKLESQKPTCQFVYLTHDLGFASSREDAKKVWIKSFSPPKNWKMENLPENDEFPESLMMELLGSEKPKLFVEGEDQSYDKPLYQLLLPNFDVHAVGSCEEVIAKTRSYNDMVEVHTKAYGLIDRDYKRGTAELQTEGIFSINVAEIENLFLVDGFVRKMVERWSPIRDKINEILSLSHEKVLEKLHQDQENQKLCYLKARVDDAFEENFDKKDNISDTMSALVTHLCSIKKFAKDSYTVFGNEIEEIYNSKNHEAALRIFNNKGLVQIFINTTKIPLYKECAKVLVKESEDARVILRDYIPQNLRDIHDAI